MKQAEMTSEQRGTSAEPLRLAQRLLAAPHELENQAQLLEEIAAAFGAGSAGLAAGPNWQPLWRHESPGKSSIHDDAMWPWHSAEVRSQLRGCRTAREYVVAHRFAVLAVWGRSESADGWILWVERDEPGTWNADDAAALGVIATCLVRAASADPAAPSWERQLESLARRHRLDELAHVIRKLAHDFGNVLTSVLGFAELTQALVPPSPAAQRYLTELHKSATSGAAWTEQLRQFARCDLAASGFTDLTQISRECYSLPQESGKRLSLSWSLPPGLPKVAMDGKALTQVLQALLQNAVEASGREGAIRISAQVRELPPAECLDYLGRVRPGRVMEITVQDNGEGIREGARARLFHDLFFTSRARKRGMGLAIVYGLVAAHGGGIRIDPQQQGGATVRLALPVLPEGDVCGHCQR
jgi:signal transduction histidine kinase